MSSAAAIILLIELLCAFYMHNIIMIKLQRFCKDFVTKGGIDVIGIFVI